jgi:hypothetical protein
VRDARDGASDAAPVLLDVDEEIPKIGPLLDAAVNAEEGAGGADVGVMSDVRRTARCLDVRGEDTLLVALGERHEHGQKLCHQGQTTAEVTKPTASRVAAPDRVEHRKE